MIIVAFIIGMFVGYIINKLIEVNSKKCKHSDKLIGTHVTTEQSELYRKRDVTQLTYQCSKCKRIKMETLNGVAKNVKIEEELI